MHLFKEFQAACEQSPRCLRMNNDSIQRKNCILECISPTCYKEIYAFDEVNVNFHSKLSTNDKFTLFGHSKLF